MLCTTYLVPTYIVMSIIYTILIVAVMVQFMKKKGLDAE